MAAGVCVAARELGLQVPRDLSVIGCDDLPVASVVDPPLTTLRADGVRIGTEGIELLVAVLAGKRPRRRTLPVELVVAGLDRPRAELNRRDVASKSDTQRPLLQPRPPR